MMLKRPVVVLMENDKRKSSYAGGSVERAIADWPADLCEYFHTGRILAWGGEPYEWSDADQDAKVKCMLERCKAINAPIPLGATSWAGAVDKLLTLVDRPGLELEPEPE
jgi:hypothetical protein